MQFLKSKRVLILAVVIAIAVTAGLFFISSNVRKSELVKYSSPTLGFEIMHPREWEIKEEAAESGPDILALDTRSRAFVRIRGFVDPYLNSAEVIKSSIVEYQKSLALQEGVEIVDFQLSEVKDNIGGFTVAGKFLVNNTIYLFKERGWLSMAGQVLILRAADTPQGFNESLPTMEKIMDSFKII